MSNHLLKERRQRLGLSQAELAERVGSTKFVLSRIENGQTPSLVVAAALERELGIPAASWVAPSQAEAAA